MTIDALGDVWQPGRHPGAAAGAVGARRTALRVASSRPRRSPRSPGGVACSFDGQGLVRVPEIGPLRARRRFRPRDPPSRLGAEARRGGGGGASATLRRSACARCSSPMARAGSTVYYGGTRRARPGARGSTRDPTGAGDAFSTAYIVARNAGFAPVGAARRATAVVASMLARSMNALVATVGRRASPSTSRRTRSSRGTARSRPPAPLRSTCRASSRPRRPARRSSRSSTRSRRSLVSHDAGSTWRESGRGLPPGRAVAIADDDPDLLVYAARNRLYVSRNGGVFWSALAVELPEIEASRPTLRS